MAGTAGPASQGSPRPGSPRTGSPRICLPPAPDIVRPPPSSRSTADRTVSPPAMIYAYGLRERPFAQARAPRGGEGTTPGAAYHECREAHD
ncbi:hypothetical protein Mame01_33750 [Microbispora amethystogenes]|nr:hypothetical protein Mame01_33750 [Microbispora amethystogenes]